MAKLVTLLEHDSKHSDYQSLHPLLRGLVPGYVPGGKKQDLPRREFFSAFKNVEGCSVLDIGANTGYFSFDALDRGARRVVAFEGERAHADFIGDAAERLGLSDRLEVMGEYFDFDSLPQDRFDVCYCLNVLHHAGDDYDRSCMNAEEALSRMRQSIRSLRNVCDVLFLQIGFNWKGDTSCPLFANGFKSEVVEFVRDAAAGVWDEVIAGAFDPESDAYRLISSSNGRRFDALGEFANRPLFVLR